MAPASTDSSKSIVTMTLERSAGSTTNGLATLEASAHEYRRPAESAVRAEANSSPPLALSHWTWLLSVTRVESAGVLYVWFFKELSMAVLRFRKSGTQRLEAPMRAARSSAAGENRPSHSPPSEAKFFCGAK